MVAQVEFLEWTEQIGCDIRSLSDFARTGILEALSKSTLAADEAANILGSHAWPVAAPDI